MCSKLVRKQSGEYCSNSESNGSTGEEEGELGLRDVVFVGEERNNRSWSCNDASKKGISEGIEEKVS